MASLQAGYRRKNIAKIFFTSRAIANLSQILLPWQRESVKEKCRLQRSMAQPPTSNGSHSRATERHLPLGITQYYLPPDTGEHTLL